MIEKLRIFGLLLRKSWLVRKRRWILSLFGQILFPAGLVLGARLAFDNVMVDYEDTLVTPPPGPIVPIMALNDLVEPTGELTYPLKRATSTEWYDFERTIMYAPANGFVDRLVGIMSCCLKFKTDLRGFQTENELTGNLSSYGSFAIIFDESTDYSTKNFHYKIRQTTNEHEYSTTDGFIQMTDAHMEPSVQMQICLDRSILEIVSNATTVVHPFQMLFQRIPDPRRSLPPSYSFIDQAAFAISMIIISTIPVLIEISVATYEKFRGVNVLISMNGISNAMNHFSWIVSGLLPLTLYCVLTISLMLIRLSKRSYALNDYADPLVLFIVFTFNNLHALAFGIHISAYFAKPVLASFAFIIINMIAVVLSICGFGDQYRYLVHYVGIIAPDIFLHQIMLNIRSHIDTAARIQWTNLFGNPNPQATTTCSIGMILIFSVIGFAFHFLLGVYVYEINPGKYGVGKHPLFFLMCTNCERSRNKVKNLMSGEVNHEYYEPIVAGNLIPGIKIRSLEKSYSISLLSQEKVQALQGISIDIYQGQITTLLGHNGAGKSTLMSILTRMISPSDGTVVMNSIDLRTDASEILKDVGLCAQDDMYFASLTVKEQLEFFAMLRKKNKPRPVIQEDVMSLLIKIKLLNVKDVLPSSLSGDQQRKLCLGMAFVGDPSILILDEPTTRLDYESKRLIWDILMEMKGQKTILISTHDMNEADVLGDRIAIMHHGQLKSYGTSLYLKKIIAGHSNIEIILSIEHWSDPQTIRAVLYKEAIIIVKQDKKMILSIPSSVLTSCLINLESKKEDLGVSNYRLSLVSLEQVFLKVTQENDRNFGEYETINTNVSKFKSTSLYIQSVRALLSKKMNYALKNFVILLVQLLTVINE